MPPKQGWARKVIGANGNRMAGLDPRGSTSAAARTTQATMAMNRYLLDATLGRPLPRPAEFFEQGIFTPNTPSPSWPIDIQRGSQAGGPDPRVWQYPVGWNLPTGPRTYEPVSFDTLRMTGRQIEPVRAAIQLIKNEMFNADWTIKVSDPNLARAEGRDYKREEKKRITAFFKSPDFLRGQSFAAWGKLLMEERLVTDALSIYPRHTVGGDVAALQILDGSTIKPLLDLQGGRPQAPFPAFQQYLYGVPRSEFAAYGTDAMLPQNYDQSVPSERNLRASQLMYLPVVTAANTVYGFPPTEQVLQTAVTYLRRMNFWQSYFVEGDIPATFIMGGENWTPEQLERWEAALHSLMAGDPSFRHRLKAVPFGTNIKEMKQPNFDVNFDEFLLKVVAMIFGVTSSELFGLSSSSGLGGRGFLEEQTDQNERKAILGYRRDLQDLLDLIIAVEFGEPDLCFRFDERDMVDRLKQAQIDDVNLKNGSTFIEEVREARGVGGLEIPEALVPHIETRAGLTSLDQIDELNQVILAQARAGAAGAGGVSTGSTASGGGTPGAGGGGPNNPGSHPGPKEGSPAAAKAVAGELEQFARFIASGKGGTRPFDFSVLPKDLGELLEKVATGVPVGPAATFAPHDGVHIDLGAGLETGLSNIADALRSRGPEAPVQSTIPATNVTVNPIISTPASPITPPVMKQTDVEYDENGRISRLIDKEILPE